jgi:hypothetical protein
MKVVFLGPTLGREAAKAILPGAVYLPPVAQGDIASLCRALVGRRGPIPSRPSAIGIIDGVFRQSLSIWHKEILFALSLGVRVLGASSIGALRAVECEPWGAEPIGRITQWVRDELVSDGDVALAHAGAEHGFRGLSVPVVNVIASLEASEGIKPERRAEMLEAARAIFYAERRWPAICTAAHCTKEERHALKIVDQKALDAGALLEAMREDKGIPPGALAARNIYTSYGGVLQKSDVRLVCADGKPRRAWQVARANPWCAAQAADRQLALEMARSLGLGRESQRKEPDPELAAQLDLLPHELEEFLQEEALLEAARLWLRASDGGHGEPHRRLSYLRSSAIYAQAKTGAITPKTT